MLFRDEGRRGSCEHVAIVYDGIDDLCARLAPGLRRASEEKAAVLICVDEPTASRIRADFGSASDSYAFVTAQHRYSTPGVAMAVLDRFVADALSSGSTSAWSIGSIPFGVGGPDSWWLRYEEAVSHVFADRALRAVCAYDARTTPPQVRPRVLRSHETVDGDWSTGDDSPPALLEDNLSPSRAPDLVLVDVPPRKVRAAIDRLFEDLNIGNSLDDMRLLASELATNALVHGRTPAQVRLWREGSVCVVQVQDGGVTPIDEYAEFRPRAGGVHGGFGLWTVGQLAEAVEITHDEDGNTVTVLVAARPGDAHPHLQSVS